LEDQPDHRIGDNRSDQPKLGIPARCPSGKETVPERLHSRALRIAPFAVMLRGMGEHDQQRDAHGRAPAQRRETPPATGAESAGQVDIARQRPQLLHAYSVLPLQRLAGNARVVELLRRFRPAAGIQKSAKHSIQRDGDSDAGAPTPGGSAPTATPPNTVPPRIDYVFLMNVQNDEFYKNAEGFFKTTVPTAVVVKDKKTLPSSSTS
jgi:hypothetical protein